MCRSRIEHFITSVKTHGKDAPSWLIQRGREKRGRGAESQSRPGQGVQSLVFKSSLRACVDTDASACLCFTGHPRGAKTNPRTYVHPTHRHTLTQADHAPTDLCPTAYLR